MSNERLPDTFRIAASATIEAGGDEGRKPRFHMVAYTGGLMRIEGFPHPVVVDLEGLEIPRDKVPIRLDHDRRQGVGHAERVAVEDGKLVAEGSVSRNNPWSRDVADSSAEGYPWQASIGADVVEAEMVPAGRTVKVNGQTFEGPVHVVRRAVLKEISFVDSGADANTSARVAAKDNEEQTMNADVKDDSTKTPEAESGRGEHEETPQAVSAAEPAARMRAEAAAESRRIAAIRKLCGPGLAEIEAQAIEEGWDETQTELEVLRASRPKAPAIHERGSGSTGPQVLEAAALMTGGISADRIAATHGEQTVEAADRRFRHGIGLQQLLLEAAWTNGYTGRHFREDPRAVLRAAFSTFALPGILSNVANKFLLDGFMSVEQTWQEIAATRSVKDFKAVTSYRLTGGFEYEEVGPDGELKHAEVDEETFGNQARTYGRIFGLTRKTLIDDDMDALSAVPRRIGRGGALKLNKVFWAEYLDNAAFFTAGRKNYQAGADTALSVDGLTAGQLLFRQQVDPDGNPLALTPRKLLVPPALEVTAAQLMSSTKLTEGGGSSKSKVPTDNPFAGRFQVVSSVYLNNDQIAGGSAKAWYLLADPGDMPVVEVAFLNGKRRPTVEQAEADFNTLGIQFRGYFDFGVAKQDWRAGIKMKGEA